MTSPSNTGLGVLLAGVLCGACLLSGLMIGDIERKARIVEHCKTFSAFKIDDTVYECKERKNG